MFPVYHCHTVYVCVSVCVYAHVCIFVLLGDALFLASPRSSAATPPPTISSAPVSLASPVVLVPLIRGLALQRTIQQTVHRPEKHQHNNTYSKVHVSLKFTKPKDWSRCLPRLCAAVSLFWELCLQSDNFITVLAHTRKWNSSVLNG